MTGDGRPSFGSLLAASLRCDSTNRAWFDESCGYAWVRQSRVPLQLPKVRWTSAFVCLCVCSIWIVVVCVGVGVWLFVEPKIMLVVRLFVSSAVRVAMWFGSTV